MTSTTPATTTTSTTGGTLAEGVYQHHRTPALERLLDEVSVAGPVEPGVADEANGYRRGLLRALSASVAPYLPGGPTLPPLTAWGAN